MYKIDQIEKSIDTLKNKFLEELKNEMKIYNNFLKEKTKKVQEEFDIYVYPGEWVYSLIDGKVKKIQIEYVKVYRDSVEVKGATELGKVYFKTREEAVNYHNKQLENKKLK